MSNDGLDINVRFVAGGDGVAFLVVDGEWVPLGQLPEHKLGRIRRLYESALRRWSDAQTGPQPGPGGLYPEGSQEQRG